MKSLKEYLETIVKDYCEETQKGNWVYDHEYQMGKHDLAEEILSEYLTEDKFCQCESCKEQHVRSNMQELKIREIEKCDRHEGRFCLVIDTKPDEANKRVCCPKDKEDYYLAFHDFLIYRKVKGDV